MSTSAQRISPWTFGIQATCGRSGLLKQSVRLMWPCCHRCSCIAHFCSTFTLWSLHSFDPNPNPPGILYHISCANQHCRHQSHFHHTTSKAERQKAQSEQHIASQTPGKRSRVEFTKESASAGGRESGRKNRLDDGGKQQSYMYGEGSSKDSYSKDRKKTRWG